MEHKQLRDYGVIGNLETCPLIGSDGSIEWCCFPEMASPSVFGALLDPERGGYFAVRPTGEFDSTQSYVPRTNVLQTTFETASGEAVLTDFMPVMGTESTAELPARAIYRKIECSEGNLDLEVTFEPRFDYARASTRVEPTDTGVLARANGERAFLSGPVALSPAGNSASGTRTVSTGESVWLALQYGTHEPRAPATYEAALEATIEYWRAWARRCTHPSRCVYNSPRYDLVVRSGLTLKLLMHWATGAIAAAPTTSLPETIGGERNWDYRFNWIRDAALTVRALYELGNTEEAWEYFSWCLSQAADDPEAVQQPFYRPLYGLRGETDLDERELTHLTGYRGSTPVRVGNAARDQRQLDIYGELVLAVYETSQRGATISAEMWKPIRGIVEYVCEVWDEPDEGIWEVRNDPQHFVHSKVMCWVVLDRAIAMAVREDFEAPIEQWREHRRRLRETVLERGYDEALNGFTRTLDGEALDATGLLLPIVGFLPADDPRVQGTIDAIVDRLATEDGLVYRYDGEDGLAGEEGAFMLCSFWLVDALALSGRIEEARRVFESVTEYATPLGLFAEEIDPETGEHRGNFPQAFSHVGLINSALSLGRAVGREDPGSEPLGFEYAGNTEHAEDAG